MTNQTDSFSPTLLSHHKPDEATAPVTPSRLPSSPWPLMDQDHRSTASNIHVAKLKHVIPPKHVQQEEPSTSSIIYDRAPTDTEETRPFPGVGTSKVHARQILEQPRHPRLSPPPTTTPRPGLTVSLALSLPLDCTSSGDEYHRAPRLRWIVRMGTTRRRWLLMGCKIHLPSLESPRDSRLITPLSPRPPRG
ncbi:hypothetical protein CC2G_001811 [Coprinopsis cinerea AmutBmut pab1-1]|nr:hypothetical protein CC2G_001811 [Coprinopsis cinerea AmutBmut pab1-1]